MSNVIIIGGGHAAAEAVTALRQNGWRGGITLIGEEPHLPYQRPPLSKAFLDGSVGKESLAIKKPQVYKKTETTLKLGIRVTSIDASKQEVTLDNNEVVGYQYLIIATGTRARALPVPGADRSTINYLRTIDDVEKIQSQIKQDTRLLIVGAGYIGLELAASATKLGAKVTVLEAMNRVLARVTCEAMSEFYQELHRQNDVVIKLNSVVSEFTGNDTSQVAILKDGEEVAFDCAVVGIGVIPNTELASDAGLECDNGILVNEYCQTSNHNIFAIGDCCNHPNTFYQTRVRLESVPNAMEQAKTVAKFICKNAQPYEALPWFWSDQYDVKLQTAGLSQGFTDFVVRGNPADKKFCIFYLRGKQLIAVDAINSPPDFMKAKQLIPKGFEVSKEKLVDTTSPWFL